MGVVTGVLTGNVLSDSTVSDVGVDGMPLMGLPEAGGAAERGTGRGEAGGSGPVLPAGLTAVLLLAGGSRRPELASSGRSPLALPLADGEVVLGRLLAGLGGGGGGEPAVAGRPGGTDVVAGGGASEGGNVRLLTGAEGLLWPSGWVWRWPWVRVESDPRALRGTGGVLMDATLRYPAEAWVLVVQAAQVRTEPLAETAERLMAAAKRGVASGGGAVATEASVVISTDEAGSPDGVMLMRCGALRQLKPVGFVDFKEQALAELAKVHRVVASRGAGRSVGVRTLRQYIEAVAMTAGAAERDPLGELDPSTAGRFRLVESGGVVEEGALLVDSVVLRGGVVESGGVVRRGLVGPGGRVRRTAVVVERLVGGEGGGAGGV